MLREIVLTPTRTVSPYSSAVSPATSPYPWLGSGSTTVHEAWSEPVEPGATPNTTKWAYSWNLSGPEHLVGFEPGPTLALFTKVKFEMQFDTMQTGPNNWYFPPQVPAGPGAQLVMLGRNGTTRHYGTYWYIGQSGPPDLNPVNNYNTQPSDGDVWSLTPVMSWELTSHPEGGPFTLEDINHLVAGYRSVFYDGPSGRPYDPSQGSFFKLRVPYVRCTVTIQDLGGYVRSVRHNGSATLRIHRKARNTISMSVPAHEAKKEIGEAVHIAHWRGPNAEQEGWGERALERRSGFIVERTYWPESLKIVDTAYDLADFSCEAWAAFMIPIAWTPELSGLAYLDQGGEWTLTRDQDAWSLRPGDGAALRVLADYPNLSEEGMAIHSANGVELALHNVNLLGAGWSTTGASGGTVTYAAETNSPVADELGYATAVRMTFPGTPGTSGKERTISLTAGNIVSVRVRVRNISVDDPGTKFLEAVLKDSSGNFWNESTRTWDASPVYNPIPATGGFGEVIFDQVTVVNTETHTIQVGRFSSAINSATFVIALVSVQRAAHGCGMPLVTLASEITRIEDVFEMDNASPYTFWHRSRGMAIVEFKPFWRAEALGASTEKPIVRAEHTGGAFDELRFVADTTDTLVFERFDGGGSQALSIDILDADDLPLKLNRGYYVRVFCRWLDAEGWRQRAPWEVALGYAIYQANGTFVSYHEVNGVFDPPDAETESVVRITNLDGWVRWLEVKKNPLSGTQAVWRR